MIISKSTTPTKARFHFLKCPLMADTRLSQVRCPPFTLLEVVEVFMLFEGMETSLIVMFSSPRTI
jgi:hypothetical protein